MHIIHTASTCTNAIKQKSQVWGVSKGADIQSLDEAALLEGRHTCVTSPHPWIPGHVDKGKYGTGGEICQDSSRIRGLKHHMCKTDSGCRM